MFITIIIIFNTFLWKFYKIATEQDAETEAIKMKC